MKPLFQPHECLTENEIRSYLANQATTEERFRIENHLLDCPFCTDALEGFELLERSESIPTKNKSNAKVVSLRPRTIISVAAAVSILFAAVLWLNGALTSSSGEELYASNYSVYPSDLSAVQYRGEQEQNETEEETHPDLLAAAVAYNDQSFNKVISHLQDFLRTEGPNEVVEFHLAMAMLESDKVPESIPLLETVRNRKSVYYEEASWYLALALLKQRERTKANLVLKDLVDLGTGRYYEKAKNLHSKLWWMVIEGADTLCSALFLACP